MLLPDSRFFNDLCPQDKIKMLKMKVVFKRTKITLNSDHPKFGWISHNHRTWTLLPDWEKSSMDSVEAAEQNNRSA